MVVFLIKEIVRNLYKLLECMELKIVLLKKLLILVKCLALFIVMNILLM